MLSRNAQQTALVRTQETGCALHTAERCALYVQELAETSLHSKVIKITEDCTKHLSAICYTFLPTRHVASFQKATFDFVRAEERCHLDEFKIKKRQNRLLN